MKNVYMKKTLAFLLALIMCLSMLPMSAFAEETEEQEQTETLEQVEEQIPENIAEQPVEEEPEDNQLLPIVDTEIVTEDLRISNESPETAVYPEYYFSADVLNGDGFVVTVSAAEGVVPEGTVVAAEMIESTAVDSAVDMVREEGKNVSVSYTFDVKLVLNGEELEPNGPVNVVFSMAEKKPDIVSVDVYHIDDETNQVLEVFEESGNEVAVQDTSAETEIAVTTEEGFSYYVVEFTYNDLQYVLEGDTAVQLSVILSALGIEGEVESAVSDAPELFDIENGFVIAKKAFATGQIMIVTMTDGQKYIIEVTDANPNGQYGVDFSSYGYGSANPFYYIANDDGSYPIQCTWYCWGRAYELLGINVPMRWNACTWYDVAKSKGYEVGSTPREKSIAVFGGEYGHVAFVEKVDSGYVYITEANFIWDGITYQYHEDRYSINDQNRYNLPLLGYVYLTSELPQVQPNLGWGDLSTSSITNDNFVISYNATNSGYTIRNGGVIIATSDISDLAIAKKSDLASVMHYMDNVATGYETAYNLPCNYDMKNECKFSLSPGTTYYVRPFLVDSNDDVHLHSSVAQVTTTGSGWNDWTSGDNSAETLVNCAEAQVGKMAANLGFSGDWCAMFVAKCGNKVSGDLFSCIVSDANPLAVAGDFLISQKGIFTCFTDWANNRVIDFVERERASSFSQEDLIYTTRNAYTPQKGDIIIFSWSKPYWSHIGIVRYSDANNVYYVDGNTEGDENSSLQYWETSKVAYHSKGLSDSSILGYVRPKYYLIDPHFSYVVTFDANNGTCLTETKTVNFGETYGSLPIPTRQDYVFTGWFLDQSCTQKVTSSTIVSTSGNHVLYAGWIKRESYTISYYANGGSGAPDNQTFTTNTCIQLSETVPVRNGYSFIGWSTSNTALKPSYQPKDIYDKNTSLKLYAVWLNNSINTDSYIRNYCTVTDFEGTATAKETTTQIWSRPWTANKTVSSITSSEISFEVTSKITNHVGNEWYQVSNGYIYSGDVTVSRNVAVTFTKWNDVSDWSDIETVSETAATVGCRIMVSGATVSDISSVGITLFDESGNLLKSKTEVPNRNDGYIAASYYIGSGREIDCALSPGTTYQCRYHAVINGNTYYSEMYPFTTLNSSVSVNFTNWNDVPDWNKLETVTESYAVVGAAITVTNTSISSISTVGIIVYDANGNEIIRKTEVPNTNRDYIAAYYSIGSGQEVNIALSPGTTYKYKYLAIINGITYYSSERSFTTWSAAGTPRFDNWNDIEVWPKLEVCDDHAAVGMKLTVPGGNIYSISTVGCIIYDKYGNCIAEKTETPTVSFNEYIAGYYRIGTELSYPDYRDFDMALTPATTYKYKLLAVMNGVTYYSDIRTFKTTGNMSYTISYDANGGTGAPGTQTKICEEDITLSIAIPTRDGYSFLGWSKSSEDTSATYAPGSVYKWDENVTLYAVWSPNTYVIAYDGNGGTGVPESQTKTHGVAAVLSSVVPSKAKYAFKGWATSQDAETVEYAPNSEFDIDADTTLYAVWELNAYMVTYDSNGGENAPDGDSKTFGEEYTIPSDIPTREGYVFMGWATEPGGAVEYKAGDKYSGDADLILYAVWFIEADGICGDNAVWNLESNGRLIISGTGATYDFDENSAPWSEYSGIITSASVTAGISEIGNYAFSGISDLEFVIFGGKQVRINPSSFAGVSADVYVLDKYSNLWTETVKNSYGGNINWIYYCCVANDGAIDLQHNKVVSPAVPVTEEENGYTEGKTCSKCGKVFIERELIPATGWAITYVLGDENAVNSVDNPARYYKGQSDITLGNPTRIGYKFVGWYKDEKLTVKATAPQITGEDTGNKTFYAKWSPVSYMIVFDGNGKTSGTVSNVSKKYSDGEFTINNKLARKGYSFIGWNSSQDGTGEYFADTMCIEDLAPYANSKNIITLYAQWEPISYTIEFESNGGTGSVSNMTLYYDAAQNLPLNAFTKEGYSLSWKCGSKTYKDGQEVKNLTFKDGEIIRMIAQWTVDKGYSGYSYGIKFNKNGGSGNQMKQQALTVGTAKALTANSYKKTGYHFAGWAISADGEAVYKDKEKVIDLNIPGGAKEIELFAVWEKNSYTVTFNGNGGKIGKTASYTQNMTYDAESVLDKNQFVRTGYTFIGWSRSAKAAVPDFEDEQNGIFNLTSADNGKASLYAVWEANRYTIRFNINGGESGTMANIDTSYGNTIKLPASGFSYPGYMFKGWKVGNIGALIKDKSSVSSLTAEMDGIVELYAQWTANSYTVKYNMNGGTAPDKTSFKQMSCKVNENPLSIPSVKPYFSGYTFAGWNTKTDGTGDAYGPGEHDIPVMKDKTTITLYAVWKYSVKVNPGDGEGKEHSEELCYNSSSTLNTDSFSRKGYCIAGWNTDAAKAAKGTVQYKANAVRNIKPGTTLYAVWKPITYKVVFHNNIDGVADKTKTQTLTYGKETALTANSFTWKGHTFQGWRTEDSIKTYTNKEKVTNLAEEQGAEVHLYAIWN